MIYFSNMFYDVYYHVVKFQLKAPPMHREIKKDKLFYGVILSEMHTLRGKMK
jgi:hypothetical protein